MLAVLTKCRMRVVAKVIIFMHQLTGVITTRRTTSAHYPLQVNTGLPPLLALSTDYLI